MTAPLVSILIPTYNGERFLAQTLDSARAQTHRELEILVGDDASTDATPGILAAAAAADPRIRVVRHPENVGAFENPIILLEQARGPYVKYLLHDDLLEPDCVAMLVAGMEADPTLTLAFSRRVQIDALGRELLEQPYTAALTDREAFFDGNELGGKLVEVQANLVGELTAALFRRADVPDPRRMWHADEHLLAANGDLALWLSLLAGGGRAFYTPRALSRFRLHGGQRSVDPSIRAHGLHDWPILIDWAARAGLVTPAQERHALGIVVRKAGALYEEIAGGPHAPVALETLFLATARLLELGGVVAPDDQPLVRRAHGAPMREALGVPLHELRWRAEGAVAAPALDAGEIAATIEALRAVAAGHLVLVIAPSDVEAAVPLIEDALRDWVDLDIDLVPSENPAALLRPGWVAVAPEGRAWTADAAAVHPVVPR
jgi:glycosyltransferase involved in cell wall biosynthesis